MELKRQTTASFVSGMEDWASAFSECYAWLVEVIGIEVTWIVQSGLEGGNYLWITCGKC